MGILSSFAWRCNDPLRWFCENKGKKIEQEGKTTEFIPELGLTELDSDLSSSTHCVHLLG